MTRDPRYIPYRNDPHPIYGGGRIRKRRVAYRDDGGSVMLGYAYARQPEPRRFPLARVAAIVGLIAALAWAAFAEGQATTQPVRPGILIGLDAQPTINFDEAALYGNALHRYDNGPGHNVALSTWLAEADKRGLWVMIQGTQCVAQAVDPTKIARLIAVTQDDEPDMNRYDSQKSKPEAELATYIFTPTIAPPPHPSMLGWTRYEILEGRYAAWKRGWPGVTVTANFAGPSLLNQYYTNDLKYHARYLKAADEHGFDEYPKNNGNGHLFWPAYVFDKLKAVGNPVDIYVECSDQKLGRPNGRGVTANEQGTLVWSGLGHGARREWYFPQQIGSASSPSFLYNAMQPANKARAASDWATIRQYMPMLANGQRVTVEQTPTAQGNANLGKIVWPNSETFRWTLGDESLTVALDYVGGTAPVITYAGPAVAEPPPVVTPPPATNPVPVPAPTTQPADLAAVVAAFTDQLADRDAAIATQARAFQLKIDAAAARADAIAADLASIRLVFRQLATPAAATQPANP